MSTPAPPERNPASSFRSSSLDGVRGLAAVSVVILHLMSVFLSTDFPEYRWFDHTLRILSYTPLSAPWAGTQAVIIFFILSGFALHRMLSPAAMNYRSYAARRILRLWIPYAATLTLAAVSMLFIGSHKIAGQSEWMNSFLGTRLSPQMLAQHALMIGSFDTRPLDFVIWSLVLEMRISLIFPALYWAVERKPAPLTLAVSVIVGIIGALLQHHSDPSNTSIAATLVCQTYFVIGALLSRFQSQIRHRYSLIPQPARVLLFAASLVLYCNCLRISATYSTMLGATWLVIVALCSEHAQAFLNRPLNQWLGKVSYSLYLCHGVVILSLINLLYPRLAFTSIVLICIPLIIAVSFALNRLIEQPSIALSRIAGRRLQSRCRVHQAPV